jgi:hypothetical protein
VQKQLTNQSLDFEKDLGWLGIYGSKEEYVVGGWMLTNGVQE